MATWLIVVLSVIGGMAIGAVLVSLFIVVAFLNMHL